MRADRHTKKQTNVHTDTLIAVLCTPTGGGGGGIIKPVEWQYLHETVPVAVRVPGWSIKHASG